MPWGKGGRLVKRAEEGGGGFEEGQECGAAGGGVADGKVEHLGAEEAGGLVEAGQVDDAAGVDQAAGEGERGLDVVEVGVHWRGGVRWGVCHGGRVGGKG